MRKKLIAIILIISVMLPMFCSCNKVSEQPPEATQIDNSVPSGGYVETEVWYGSGDIVPFCLHKSDNDIILAYYGIIDNQSHMIIDRYSETGEVTTRRLNCEKEVFFDLPFALCGYPSVNSSGEICSPARRSINDYNSEYFLVKYGTETSSLSEGFELIPLGSDEQYSFPGSPSVQFSDSGKSIAIWHGFREENDERSLVISADFSSEKYIVFNDLELPTENVQLYKIDDSYLYYLHEDSINVYDLQTGELSKDYSSSCSIEKSNNYGSENPVMYWGTPVYMGHDNDFHYYIDKKGVNRVAIGGSLSDTILDSQNCLIGSSKWKVKYAEIMDDGSFYILYCDSQSSEFRLMRYIYDSSLQYPSLVNLRLLCIEHNSLIDSAVEYAKDSKIFVSVTKADDIYSSLFENNRTYAFHSFQYNPTPSVPELQEDTQTLEYRIESYESAFANLHSGNQYLADLLMSDNAPDIIIWDASALYELGKQGYLLDLFDRLDRGTIPSPIFNTFRDDSSMYAIPLAINSLFVYGQTEKSIDEICKSNGQYCYLAMTDPFSCFLKIASSHISDKYNFTADEFAALVKETEMLCSSTKACFEQYGISMYESNYVPTRAGQSAYSIYQLPNETNPVTNMLLFGDSGFSALMLMQSNGKGLEDGFSCFSQKNTHPFEVRCGIAINANTEHPDDCIRFIQSIISDSVQSHLSDDSDTRHINSFGGLPLTSSSFIKSINSSIEKSKQSEAIRTNVYGDDDFTARIPEYIDYLSQEYDKFDKPMIVDFEYIWGLAKLSEKYFYGECTLDQITAEAITYTENYSKF